MIKWSCYLYEGFNSWWNDLYSWWVERTGSSACLRAEAPSDRVEACQRTSKQKQTKMKALFQFGLILTLTMASFSPKYPATHFCPSAAAVSRRSALFPTSMIGILSCVASYHKEKKCAYMKCWTSYDDDSSSYQFQMSLMSHMTYW